MDKENPYATPRTPTSGAPTSPSEPANGRGRWIAAGGITSAIGGALVWALSPWLTGEIEPWDATSRYYFLGVAGASALGSVLSGRQLAAPIVGTYLGQLIYCWTFYHPGGPVILPAAIFVTVFGSIPSLIGAGVGAIATNYTSRSSEDDRRPEFLVS